MIEQTTVMIENVPGRLAKVTSVLSEAHIDLNGISIADSADYGVLRMILSDPEKGMKALSRAGFIVKRTEVIAVQISDEPGSLQEVFTLLYENQVNIQYVYAFGTKLSGHAYVVLKADENARAESLLVSHGYRSLSSDEVEARLKA